MARPLKDLPSPDELVFKLASIGLTNEQISETSGYSVTTLQTRFRTPLTRGRGKMKEIIATRQMQIMLSDHKHAGQMAIWLGRVYLGQRETEPKNENDGFEF